jgi:hypothetical protein
LGILSPGSASAAVASAAMNPARTPLARRTYRGADARFETAPDIVISFIPVMTSASSCDVCPDCASSNPAAYVTLEHWQGLVNQP